MNLQESLRPTGPTVVANKRAARPITRHQLAPQLVRDASALTSRAHVSGNQASLAIGCLWVATFLREAARAVAARLVAARVVAARVVAARAVAAGLVAASVVAARLVAARVRARVGQLVGGARHCAREIRRAWLTSASLHGGLRLIFLSADSSWPRG